MARRRPGVVGEIAGRPIHSAHRALARVMVGAVKARENVDARVTHSRLREELFEFQVGIAGTANSNVGWQPASVAFPAPMVSAPSQRDSDLEVPQFFFGYHLYASASPVVLTAYVQQWDQDDSDYTVGALCQIGAYTPGQDDDLAFAGYVHLTFQGFSGPVIEEDDGGVT